MSPNAFCAFIVILIDKITNNLSKSTGLTHLIISSILFAYLKIISSFFIATYPLRDRKSMHIPELFTSPLLPTSHVATQPFPVSQAR